MRRVEFPAVAGTRRSGLKVTAQLDDTIYPKCIKITDAQMLVLETQHITRGDFHGEWNYAVRPALQL